MSNIIRRNSYDPFFDLFDFPFENIETKNEMMKTDIEETSDAYNLSIEVPSVKKEDVKVSLKDGYLNVSVEKKNETTDKNKEGKVIHRERFFGTYKRSYYVGDGIRQSDIEASLENGILNIEVKKSQRQEELINYIEVK